MINPLTFESNGDNQYLTWARDSASVTDAITSARTSSPLFQSSEDIRGINLSVRQGSEVVYITDFMATITNNNGTGAVTVQLMRGYISGRYFEVINEPWGSLTFSRGWGYLYISGKAWIPSNSGMMNIDTYGTGDVTNGRDGINVINRNPEDRKPKEFYYSTSIRVDGYVGASSSGLLVYWDKTKTTGEVPLSLTQQHTAEVSKGAADIDPYKFRQYYIGKYYSYEDNNYEEQEHRLPITDFKFGDKRFGFLALFAAANKDVNLDWLKTEVTDYPDPVLLSTSEKYITEYVMGPINPDKAKNEVLSGYFGINNTGMASTWNPSYTEFISVVIAAEFAGVVYNPQGYTKILQKDMDFGTSGITMTNNFDNGRDGGYSTYSSLTNRTVGPVTLTAYDTGGDRQYYGKTVDPLLSDLSVTVTRVTYTTQTAANNGDPGPGIRIFAKNDSTTPLNNIAVVDVSASLPISIPIYSVIGGVKSVIDTLRFSMTDNLRFVVDLDAIPSYKNDNGSVAIDMLYSAQTDTTFKARLTSAGLSESKFFNKWLRPHIMFWFLNSFKSLQKSTIKARIASHAKRLEQQDPGVLVKVAFGRRGVWQNRPPLQ